MTTQEYLASKLESCSHYELTEHDKSYLDQHGVADFIARKVTSKKFRKWSLTEEDMDAIRKAIDLNVKAQSPIKFTFPFGGYKLWHIPTSPEVDWAEFFMIAYYLEYIAPIAVAYEPGVEFHFSSDDAIIEQMDNVPKEDTEKYFQSFKELLTHFQKYLPQNVTIDIVRVGDMYGDAYQQELEKHVKEAEAGYPDMAEERRQAMTKISMLNIQWDGKDDWNALPEEEKKEKMRYGAIYHDAHCALEKRREFVRGEDKVLVFTTPLKKGIALGTTKTSITKFWTGFGVLEKRGERYYDRILSPSQLDKVKNIAFDTEKVDLIGMTNFKEIRVYNQKFDFVR